MLCPQTTLAVLSDKFLQVLQVSLGLPEPGGVGRQGPSSSAARKRGKASGWLQRVSQGGGEEGTESNC